MEPVSVSGLYDGDVRPQSGNADSLDGALGEGGEISGIKQASLVCDKINTGGACNMSRRIECQGKPFQNGKGSLIADNVDTSQHGQDILFGIVRNLAFTVIHDLQTVIQKYPGEICGHGSHVDGSFRIRLADDRKGSDMVHMGVADQNGIQAALFLQGAEIGQWIFSAGLPDT